MIGTNWVLHYSDQELKMFNWLLINPTLSGSRTFGSFDNEINNWWRDAWVKLIVPLQCNVPSDLSSSSNPSSEDTFQWNLSTPVPIILFLSLINSVRLCVMFSVGRLDNSRKSPKYDTVFMAGRIITQWCLIFRPQYKLWLWQ